MRFLPRPTGYERSGQIHDVTDFKNQLAVAGIFLSAEGKSQVFALWDGAAWRFPSEAGEITGVATAIHVYQGDLIIGGSLLLDTREDITYGVVRWDGASWSPLGRGLSANPQVAALAEIQGDLLVGGDFTIQPDQPGGLPIRNLARWDGDVWRPMSNDPIGRVWSIGVFHNQLFVGGDALFDVECSEGLVANVATWMQPGWAPAMDSTDGRRQLRGRVTQFQVIGDELWCAGSELVLRYDGRRTGARVAAWTGEGWQARGPESPAATPSGIALASFAHRVVGVFAAPYQLACRHSPGDANCDGAVSIADVAGFNAAIFSRATYYDAQPACVFESCDMNSDGYVDNLDVPLFIERILRGN